VSFRKSGTFIGQRPGRKEEVRAEDFAGFCWNGLEVATYVVRQKRWILLMGEEGGFSEVCVLRVL
jgi:hypothetical protein